MNDTFPLGSITEAPLSEIWHGARTARLRRAMLDHDLTLGCDICKWQVDEGRPELAFSRWFRDLPATDAEPEWPRLLELSISNTCNLQCRMCNGEWSSSIRTQREGLPPLPKVYDDAFFEDLATFLPHLERIKFLGGEPFLAVETLRVMEMLVDRGLTPSCHITTNGTQWSPRVERILEMVPVDVTVSLDGATKETYERIRVGSSWDAVMVNLDRFQEMARRTGRGVSLAYCLMTENWNELLDVCRMADGRGFGVAVNLVSTPRDMSLYFLPPDELAHVVEELEAQDRAHGGELTLSAATWTGEIDKLRSHLDARREGKRVVGLDVRGTVGDVGPDVAADPDLAQVAARRAEIAEQAERLRAEHLPPGAGRLRVDRDGRVAEVTTPEVLGFPASEVAGRSADEVIDLVSGRFGASLHTRTITEGAAGEVLEVAYPRGRRMIVVNEVILSDRGTEQGQWISVAWA